MSAKPKPLVALPDSNNLRDVLAYNIRLLRVGKGWSQEELASQCGWIVPMSGGGALALECVIEQYRAHRTRTGDAALAAAQAA